MKQHWYYFFLILICILYFSCKKNATMDSQDVVYNSYNSICKRITTIEAFSKCKNNDKLLYSICFLESEVNNGGLDQYFFNDHCNSHQIIVSSLKTINALHTAGILEKAIAIHSNKKYSEDKKSTLYEPLDEDFFNYKDNISELLYDFLNKCNYKWQ